jgi:hypothetical protein
MMSFIRRGSTVISFATNDDVVARDQRIYDQNEGLTDDVVEAALIRATERILSKIKTTAWWKDLYTTGPTPNPNPSRILARQNDFTDLCVYQALAEFILPQFADFDSEDQSERNKMGYYTQKSDALFIELIQSGDWYDFDGDGVIDSGEVKAGKINLKRIR